MIKRTLQEIADFFGCWVAMDSNGEFYAYRSRPTIDKNHWFASETDNLELVTHFVEYSGDWKDSLTAPSEPPFKEGELLICIEDDSLITPFRANLDDFSHWRRPTEAEWKKLRGEE